ncbi:TPA: hypothetical protein L5627_006005 [Pseudomonas aeruginosa]|nr:hypothetical protein [Pseudomonas aeruginosa]
MDRQNKLHLLNEHLKELYSGLDIDGDYSRRADPLDQRAEQIHLTFTFHEEGHADSLIRAARQSLATDGPEYWLPDYHPGAAQFRQTEHIQFKVRKSLIRSHLYWGVSFILCAPEEGYSLLEDTQP